MTPLLLSAIEARVIGSLVEKSITTPQYYPMTVNAIMLAANQKSCRNPVLALRENEVAGALTDLGEKGLASRDDAGGRVPKWRHAFQHHLLLQPPVLAVLVTLMLRGPQTLSELRAHATMLGGPPDAEGVQRALQDLADRAQPLVVLLPRAAGQKEQRYAHTLSGPPEQASPAAFPAEPAAAGAAPAPTPSLAGLEERLRALEARVAALESLAAPKGPDAT